MEIIDKNALDYSDPELIWVHANDPQKSTELRNVYGSLQNSLEQELSKLGGLFADFTSRISAIMTVSGLFAFLPALVGQQDTYLKYFLIWIFPFFAAGIVSFYFTSLRVNALLSSLRSAAPGSSLELVDLKARVLALQDIWRNSFAHFQKTTSWYRATSAFIYTYLVSFVVNFYLFVFIQKPQPCVAVLIAMSSVLIGCAIYFRGIINSLQVAYGPTVAYQHGIGGASTGGTTPKKPEIKV